MSMSAVVLTTPGESAGLRCQSVPQPAIQFPHQVLVQIKAASVNPIDTKLRRRGMLLHPGQPAILGCDGSGVVVACGSQVTRFQPGQAVYYCYGGLGGMTGSYAEYIVLPETALAAKPAGLSFVAAAALPLVGITAWEALFERGQVQAGETVLIHAGAGGVGHIALQLATQRGARVFTTVSSLAKGQLAQSLGAAEVLYYRESDFTQAIAYATQGQGVDYALDTVGGETFHQTPAAVRYYGRLVTLLQPPPMGRGWEIARQRNLTVGYTLMLTPQTANLPPEQGRQTQILAQLAAWVAAGHLSVTIAQTYPLAAAASAHRHLEQGGFMGKLVLTMD
ncbi:alcohol dehydrogenase zinc-binding domain-containing protein [Gloeomargarita lithophora Alchichica-D10]|uniref:Alcohol dehydrogenase zinc-binding domain-containing protein n=1 Tax=Gloeomargarita lithophora Alchichica-D10 TaxID=1188229 RepID=A0A1J0ABG5_9CYAN|nr:zinc-binding dehydrogenase [Gloeomargarita lithophora]APB33270.1 alcohol dehydrogenase zinc-binding domain-containing protein [Gloeomargarita lithophora Alchichica-D10]